LIRAIRALRPAKLYFLDERHKTQPWGLYGGRAAQPNDAWLVRADGELIKLPSKFDDLKLEPGDMFVMRTGGGGGWGDPFERDPALVQRDVTVGLLTVDQARELYGVIIDGETLALDEAATTQLRNSTEPILEWIDRGMPVDSPDPGEFRQVTERPYPWLVVPEAPAEGSLATA
jgi:N-methylhydantoinase B